MNWRADFEEVKETGGEEGARKEEMVATSHPSVDGERPWKGSRLGKPLSDFRKVEM